MQLRLQLTSKGIQIWMDVTNGDVYLQVLEEKKVEYELLDNLFAYFP